MTFGQLGMRFPSLEGMTKVIPASITRVGLHLKITDKATEFMRECFGFILNQKLCQIIKLDQKILNHFSCINITDSSGWDINKEFKNLFPGFGGGASEAACKIQVTYEYKSGTIGFCEVTAGTVNDQKYSKTIAAQTKEKELTIEDLGYFSLASFKTKYENGAFFVSRFLNQTAVFNQTTNQRIILGDLLKKSTSNMCQLDVILGAEHTQVKCRMLCLRMPEEMANINRMKLRKTSRKKKFTPKKESLFLCGWLILITNTSEEILPIDKVWDLYRLRWQIELLFKQFKSILAIHKTNVRNNKNRLLCEIYGKLIVAVIVQRIHGQLNAESWNNKKQELSFDKIWKRIQERAFEFQKLLYLSIKKAIKYFCKIIKTILTQCHKLKQLSRITSLAKLSTPSNNFGVLKI